MATSVAFPWPDHSEAHAVIVRPGLFVPPNVDLWARSDAATHRAAAVATRTLRARWPGTDAAVRDGDVVDRILAEAAGWHAHALVMGWRGHGRFRRLLMGSVSRAVLRRAETPVLVVHRAGPRMTHLAVGVDGSSASRRAVRLLARAVVPKGGTITLVTVLPSQLFPSHPLLPGLTAELRAEALARGARERARAERIQKRSAASLREAGWRVREQVRTGAPLYELLRSVYETRAEGLVIGATSSSGSREGHVGSTAEGAVNRSAVPVLVVP